MATMEVVAPPDAAPPRRGPWRQAAGRFARRPLGMAALVAVLVLFLVAVLTPRIAPYPVGQIFLELLQHPKPPLSPDHLLGTDPLGHDFLTQMLWAVRETMLTGFLCAGLAAALGAAVGILAGYVGGALDAAVASLSHVVVAVPAIVVLGYVSTRSPLLLSPLQNALWLAAILWPGVARVVAASASSLRRREFVEAAHAAGASGPRLVFRHVLPNASGPIVVAATSIVAQAVLVTATVQYLGFSSNQAHAPTLGGLVADATQAQSLILTGHPGIGDVWWLYALPSALLVALLLAVTFLGDQLDEALNPAAGQV
jgi:peptide/nickel transport system permease protein